MHWSFLPHMEEEPFVTRSMIVLEINSSKWSQYLLSRKNFLGGGG